MPKTKAEPVICAVDQVVTDDYAIYQGDSCEIIRALPGIAPGPGGAPLVSPELVVLFKLPKKDDPKGSNVNVRGVTPAAFALQ